LNIAVFGIGNILLCDKDDVVILRIGTAGGISDDLNSGDFVITTIFRQSLSQEKM